MSTVISLVLLIVFLAAGFVAVRVKIAKCGPLINRIFSAALYLLLFSMGLRLGQSRDILANLSLVGALSVSSTLFACAGTVILHILLRPLYRKFDPSGLYGVDGRDGLAQSLSGNRNMSNSRRLAMLFNNLKKPMILLVLVILGTAAGLALPTVPVIRDGSVATWLLYFLLFIIGMQMASGDSGLGKLLCQPTALLVPVVTILGTLAGSLGTLVFAGMTPGKALALGSGFGWYSLSGVLISNLGDPTLGAASFLANLFRETLSFLAIPVLAATGRCESGIGIAGATSMDVTLPVVEDTWGATVVPLSVAHGVILSFLVPFLVPLFMSF